jgi:hypothetical protein
VNDPAAIAEPGSGARHGVVHVLGSVPALIGTADAGGTERRPVDRTSTVRNIMRAEHVAGVDVALVLVVLTLLTRACDGVKGRG